MQWPRPRKREVEAKLEVDGPGFSPDTVLTKTTLKVGKDSYPTSEVTAVRAFTKPSALVAAVYQVTVGDQVVNFSFGQRDEAAGLAIVEALERMAARNTAGSKADEAEGATAQGSRAAGLQSAEGMYEWCSARGLADVMDEENGLRHFRVIERALEPGEEVLGSFAAAQNYESAAKSDGVFAFAVTRRRIVASQQRVFGLEPWSLTWDAVGSVELLEGRGHSVITMVGEDGATSVGVAPEAGKAVLELVRSAWRGEGAQEMGARASEAAMVAEAREARAAMDPYEEVKKAKELLDLGILTQEEFDRKKRELLGL